MIKKKKPVSTPFVWNYKTFFKGKGIEFADFRQYEFGDDIKNIDFVRSLQEWNTLIRQFQEERELHIFFILDLSDSLLFAGKWENKLHTFIKNFEFLSQETLKNNDKIGALFVTSHDYIFFPPKKWHQNFQMLWEKLKKLHPSWETQNINQALSYFLHLPFQDALVFLCTDKMEEIEEKNLKILAHKHELIYVNIFDSFENTLGENSLVYQFDGWGSTFFLSSSHKKKIQAYNALRAEKIHTFSKKIHSYQWDYIRIDDTTHLPSEWMKFFFKR